MASYASQDCGTTLWLTGNIGGLMTSGPSDPVYDAFLEKNITKAGHDKARAFGYSLANSVIEAAEQDEFSSSANTQLAIRAHEIELGITNFMLALGTLTGLVDSDPTLHWTPPFVRYRSEVAFIQLGNATITGIPGELYPEIAVGGIENPVGADYVLPPQRSASPAQPVTW